MKKSYLIAALFAGMSANVAATESTPVPNVFTAGDAIVAADMNENFAALAARISALESGLITPVKTYAQNIAGHTYSGQFIYFGFSGEDDGNGGFGTASNGNIADEQPHTMRFVKGGGTTSITLNADGSVSNDKGAEAEIGSLLTTVCQYADDGSCTSYNSQAETNEDAWDHPESTTTWSVNEDSGTVTIVWDGEAEETDVFQASEDGSILYNLKYNNTSDGSREVENAVSILVRQK